MLLKLYVTIDDLLKRAQRRLSAKHLPHDPHGDHPQLSAAEVATRLVMRPEGFLFFLSRAFSLLLEIGSYSVIDRFESRQQ